MRLNTVLLFAEALITSAYVRFSLSFLPFKKVVAWLGTAADEQVVNPGNSKDTAVQIRAVQAALARCHKYALWPTECYTLALTGKLLLQRRGLDSTLYIGFRKNANGRLSGHAWLTSNGLCVAGNTDISQFVVHSTFS